MESLWNLTAELPRFQELDGKLHVRAAVIGGGMAGLLTAYYLERAGVHAAVLEAGRICSGQTGGTTAKITSQHGLVYQKLLHSFGSERTYQYARANQRAIEEYRRIVTEGNISCEWADCPSYLYSAGEIAGTEHAVGIQALEREAQAAQQAGIPAVLTTQTELPFPVKAALRFDGQARFHPLKFLQAIVPALAIYENTPAVQVEENRITTPNGTVTAEHIIFACHYPFLKIPGLYFMRMHQERSYVLALENTPLVDGMYLGIDPGGISLRSSGNYLLLGGGGHRTGENMRGGQYQKLRETAARYWPDSREAAHWSAQDCMTLDQAPYIGRFSASKPNWYVAAGFHKWGMTSSMVSAMLLTDLITSGSSPYENVFDPGRLEAAASAKEFVKDSGKAAKGLAREFLTAPDQTLDDLPAGSGGIVESGSGKVGAYKTESGEVFLVQPKCPHLGCQLSWNPEELSWDCPCHGSRFDYRGRLLDGPAQSGLPIPD